MAEHEIGCLRTQGLKQRIATDRSMKKVVTAIVTERNTRHARIAWGFTKEKAERKFPTLYA